MGENSQYLNFSEKIDFQQSLNVLKRIAADLDQLEPIAISTLDKANTALIIIDMINGFTSEGPLASDRVEKLINPIAEIIKKCDSMKKVFVCDHHPINAVEFDSYPPHAIQGSREALIVDSLYELQDDQTSVIFKNSTNGMMTKEMIHYLEAHHQLKDYIIVGDCTDICIMQFALSLKAYFNEKSLTNRVIVPMNLTETFDLDATNHYSELMNLFAYYNMKMNGVVITKSIL